MRNGDGDAPVQPESQIRNPQSAIRNRLYVVVVALAAQRVGLVVDELQGEGELVIKALDAEWASRSPVAGAAILGDGRVVMILDPAALIDQAQGRARAIAERGMRNAEYRPESPEPIPQSAIRNPQSGAKPAGVRP